MRKLKSKLAAIILGFAGLTTTVQADCFDPCNTCCPDIEVGVDWLYWSPCISDQHFAITYDDASTTFKTHYICDDWDSGVRVYGKVKNLWNNFNGAVVYTYIKPDNNGHVDGNGVRFSYGTPFTYDPGDSISFDWELEYQTLDAVLSYSIDVTQNRCLKVEAFSGLTWIDVKQNRKDVLTEQVTELTTTTDWNRHNDFWAIGPSFGINTSLRICDCFNVFGMFKTSLVVGESESKETLTTKAGSDPENSVYFHADDECSCFPGIHLATGIDYELCICDCTFGIRLGWEYVQWINAPTFPFYEQGDNGIRSAPSTNNLTMQGIFLGLNATF
jgi:hypothetical protein